LKIPQKQNRILHEICQKIYDKKGFNIITLDVRGVSSITDYFIIAEGNVERHVQALFWAVEEEREEREGVKPLYTEGEHTGNWAVLDYGDIMVHFFTPELRERYRLEQIWTAGKVVDIKVEHAAVV